MPPPNVAFQTAISALACQACQSFDEVPSTGSLPWICAGSVGGRTWFCVSWKALAAVALARHALSEAGRVQRQRRGVTASRASLLPALQTESLSWQPAGSARRSHTQAPSPAESLPAPCTGFVVMVICNANVGSVSMQDNGRDNSRTAQG